MLELRIVRHAVLQTLDGKLMLSFGEAYIVASYLDAHEPTGGYLLSECFSHT